MTGWSVYLIECADGSLYCGITNHLPRRLEQHHLGRASKYTATRRPVKLVYYEPHSSRSTALRREAEIKSLPRFKKRALVQEDRSCRKRSSAAVARSTARTASNP